MFSDHLRGRCPTSNRLLAALPTEVLQRWTPRLEWVEMPQGQVLRESGQVMRHVYFPTTAIISLMHLTAEGDSAEIAVVGNDGLLGISLFMGSETALSRAVVGTAGGGFRLRREILMDEFDRQGTATHLLLRYTQSLITQMAQTAVCNRHHTVDQQLSRWLLHRLDRLEGNELQMTQESIGSLLGVRRESVSAGISRLQHARLIRHTRGAITVLDRAGLEQRACECYAVVRKESDRLVPPRAATVRFNQVCRSAVLERAA
jgi:CRP-like cAMP-binding protein